MTATVRHVTSSSGLRKFQTDGFLFVGVLYNKVLNTLWRIVYVNYLWNASYINIACGTRYVYTV